MQSGTQIINLDQENMSVIRQKSLPVYDQIEKDVSPALVEALCGEKLQEIREAAR